MAYNRTVIPLLTICNLNHFPFIEDDFDAITYYQLLAKVVESVNATITEVNAVTAEFEDISEGFETLTALVNQLQARIDTIQAELTAYLNAKFDSLKDEIETELAESKAELEAELIATRSELNAELSAFRTQVNQLVTYVQTEVLNFKNYVDDSVDVAFNTLTERINDLQNQINNISLDNIIVYNSATGLRESLQKTLLDYWRLLRQPYSITAGEYRDLNITAGEYRDLNITALDYDLKAKQILN